MQASTFKHQVVKCYCIRHASVPQSTCPRQLPRSVTSIAICLNGHARAHMDTYDHVASKPWLGANVHALDSFDLNINLATRMTIDFTKFTALKPLRSYQYKPFDCINICNIFTFEWYCIIIIQSDLTAVELVRHPWRLLAMHLLLLGPPPF